MEIFKFAIIATEITEHWNLPDDSTLKGCRVFDLAMFCVGEATYCCSLTPSSYFDDLENVFFNPDGSPLSDEQVNELDRHGYQYEALDGGYMGYVNPDRIADNPHIGDILEIEMDPADYDDSEEGRDAMRRAAWDEAREEFSANGAAWEPPLTGIIPEPA